MFEYRVNMAIQGETFFEIATVTEVYYQISGLQAGVIYEFKIEARNQYDYSEYSGTLGLLAAFIPDVPTDVVTVIESGQMKVTWQLANDNGSPVTEYKVWVNEIGTDTYTQENVDCVGNDPTVLSTKTCYINTGTLIIAPYNVDGGDSIYAKVSSMNVYGESDLSEAGNGAYYERPPDKPISLAEDISVRSASTDGLTWADGINNGGIPILDYRVNFRELNTANYQVVQDGITTQSFTVPNLILGTTYEFTVEARNNMGYSEPSDSISFLHAIPPEQPIAPVTTNSN